MSAAPISAAAQTTTTQAGSGTQGANASAGAQKTQKGPPTGFEALLAMLSAAQDSAVDTAAAPKGAVKINPKTTDAAGGGKGGDAAAEAAPHDDDGSDASATDMTSAIAALLIPTAAQPLIVATTTAKTAQGEAGDLAKGAATAAGGKTDAAALAAVLAKANEATPEADQPTDAKRLAVADPAPLVAKPSDTSPNPKPEPTGPTLAQAVTTPAAASDKSQAATTPPALPVPEAPAASPPAPEAAPVVAATQAPGVTASAAQAATPSVTPSAQATSKDRTAGTKPPRIDGVRTASATAGGGAISAKMAQGVQSQAQADLAVADATPDQTGVPVPETEFQAQADTTAGPADTAPELTAASTATAAPVAATHTAATEVRGQPQTVAALAAQIVRKLDGRSTHFDVALDPVGLGHVNVRVEIGATGKMSAALAFDTPQAAAELRGRAGELRTAMEQAGFDLSGGLSFDVASDRGQGAPSQDNQPGPTFRGRAFQATQETVGDPATAGPLYLRRSSASGVDIRI